MKVRLNGDLVLIEPLVYSRQTRSGIVLPEQAEKLAPEYGEVVLVGPGRLTDTGVLIEMPFKVHDRVFYSAFQLMPLFYNTKMHILVHAHDVVAVVEEDDLQEELLISEQVSRASCPTHGDSCRVFEAIKGGRQGVYCPTDKKFFCNEELHAKKAVS